MSTHSKFRIRTATQADADHMLAIYAPFITDSAITFEETIPTSDEWRRRVTDIAKKHPWLVAEVGGRIAGYAYACPHRARASYRWCVESAIYMHSEHKRGGIGRALYEELFAQLRNQGYINVYAGITLPNPASVGFHRSLGFEDVGVYKKIGYKMGQWHDVIWLALALGPHAANPTEPKA